MKTNQIMTRPLFDSQVKQRTSDGFFLLASIEKAGFDWRHERKLPEFNASAFLANKSQKKFVETIEEQTGRPAIIRIGRGRLGETWIHPYLMLEVAFAVAPEFKYHVYGWIYDELIKHRVDSCESYKRMSSALFAKFKRSANPRVFQHFIGDTSNQIREICGVQNGPKGWNSATEEQLKLRDKLHDTVAMASEFSPDPRLAVRIGLEKVVSALRTPG